VAGFDRLAQSFYLVSTVVFSLVCFGIGVRLLWLSRRTGGAPERAIGLGVMLTGGFGYGLLIAVALHRALRPGPMTGELMALAAAGWILHDTGVCYVLRFVVDVFEPEARWARVLSILMMGVLWTGLTGYTAAGGLVDGRPEGFWYWLQFSATGTYAAWAAVESFAYYGRMRRRLAFGLADPVVTNRFLLWGLAAGGTVAATWTISLPALLGLPGARSGHALAPGFLTATAVIGIAAVTCYWLAFVPPRWYLARLAGRVPPAAA
jgi:hypothetical protein